MTLAFKTQRSSTQWRKAMNWDQIEGNWKQLKGQAQERWGELTNDELDEAAGQRQQLVGKLQERYGYAKEEAEREADEFAKQV
jgi:uncharacterized protein YjbJ (UPF0337 family)